MGKEWSTYTCPRGGEGSSRQAGRQAGRRGLCIYLFSLFLFFLLFFSSLVVAFFFVSFLVLVLVVLLTLDWIGSTMCGGGMDRVVLCKLRIYISTAARYLG